MDLFGEKKVWDVNCVVFKYKYFNMGYKKSNLIILVRG